MGVGGMVRTELKRGGGEGEGESTNRLRRPRKIRGRTRQSWEGRGEEIEGGGASGGEGAVVERATREDAQDH